MSFFRIWGFGFFWGFRGVGFRVEGDQGVSSLGFRVWGLGFREIKVWVVGFRGIRVWDVEFRGMKV